MSEGDSFKVGDVVQLKSGEGPKMVVVKLGDGDMVRCTWFAGQKNQKADFPSAALVSPPEPPTINIYLPAKRGRAVD